MFDNIKKTCIIGIAILALIFLEMLIFINPLHVHTLCFCPILLFNSLLVLGTAKHNVDIILIWMNWAVLQTMIVFYGTFALFIVHFDLLYRQIYGRRYRPTKWV